MLKTRVFPCLLLQGTGLVKTVRFKDPTYVGDPINAVRIFNTKEVDELVLLDIKATEEKRIPPLDLVSKIAEECIMPLTVGGGIRSLEDIRKLLSVGIEKVTINSIAIEDPDFIAQAAKEFGSQSIIVSIDAKRCARGYEVFSRGGMNATGKAAVEFAALMEEKGAGEIFLNAIDRDGTMEGMDIGLIKEVTHRVSIPVIACGGVGKLEHIKDAVCEAHASAVSAGSFFVFHGRRRAVLINFPTQKELEVILDQTK